MLENFEISVMPTSSQRSNGVQVQETALLPKSPQYEVGLDAQCALHAQYVLQLLQLQRRAEFLCDITIHVRDRSFKAHKPLLAACSLYFRGLFADVDSKESTALNLTSLTPNGFQVLLDYIYSGSLAITAENSSEVLSAATCLQMTNVVETCLNFIRSSFRMSKNSDSQLSPAVNKTDIESATALVNPDFTFGKHTANFDVLTDIFNNNKLNVKIPVSRPASQDNLQILSTESINEEQFKSMLVDSHDKSPLHGQSAQYTEASKHGGDHLPSASQLQSVLPLLMTNHPRQPTPIEVQRVLTSLPSVVDASSIANPSNPNTSLPTSNSVTSRYTNPHHKSSQVHAAQYQHISATNASFTVASPMMLSSGMTHLHQNGSLSSPTSMEYSNVGSATDLTTIDSAACLSNTSERNSGATQTEALLPGFKGEKSKKTHNERSHSAENYSSDEQGNSVEISSDEDGECDAWSADRSVVSSTDLSGTPCPTSTPLAENSHPESDSPGSFTAHNLSKQRRKADPSRHKSVVSKALSLPTLSETSPASPHVPRASSTDAGVMQVITYEKAASAIAALNCSPSSSVVSPGSPSTAEVPSVIKTSPCRSVTKQKRKDKDASSEKKISEASMIVAQALHKNLLPSRKGVDDTSSLPANSHRYQTDKHYQPSGLGYEKSIDLIKIEPGGDMEDARRGFPIQDGMYEHLEDDGNIDRGKAPGEVQPQYLLKEHADTGAGQGDVALDLSMPQQCERQRSTFVMQDSDSEKLSSSRHPSDTSSLSDPGAQLAVDALSMLRHSNQKNAKAGLNPVLVEAPPGTVGTNVHPVMIQDSYSQDSSRASLSADGASPKRSATMFSRKPRRTNGGQTCTWPGCGRLFRHRNIYEEHQRLHELGIPVSQLRKCYMGARVKKTVREQLEELRTSDSVFEGSADGESSKQSRVRKRKSNSDNQEPIRKRVTVKDRPGAFALFEQPISVAQSSSNKPSVQHHPPRIRQSLSHPAPERQAPQFLQPSVPASTYLGPRFIQVMGADGVIRLAQTAEVTNTQDAPSAPGATSHAQTLQQTIVGPIATQLASIVPASVATSQVQSQNPVEATLALLGIRTPVRRSSAGATSFPMTVPLSSDQMRRRLAIRETTDVSSLPVHRASDSSVFVSVPGPVTSIDPVSVQGTTVHPGVLTLREMYPIMSRSGGAAPTGTAQPRSSNYPKPTSSN